MSAIHEDVPPEPRRVDQKLLDALRFDILPQLRGPEKATTVNDIAKMLHRHDLHERTGETLRRALKILLVDHGFPVCSSNKGFYLARDWADAEPCFLNWSHRVGGLKRSCEALERCFGIGDSLWD